MMVLGVDPGCEGALALLHPDGSLAQVLDMPVVSVRVGKTTRHRIAPAELADAIRSLRPDHVVLEHVTGRPTDVPTYAGELCRAAGIVEGIVAALGLPMTPVQPQAWRKAMGVSLPPGSKPAQRKEASRQRALQLWPGQSGIFSRKLDADRAEAALIARWGLLCAGLGAIARAA
ncbi:conserved protein of unknown function (plasmid) [Rhodovastum atsumiense]|uniref:Uncharacterized protein n=1 Tax=Rhodovastum atsumiense TaxID=504468 RepID=A0A5M6IQB7_9PROT|nr:hypothetical protein [Rhodovastum atsumiense]KAA5609675.1 hypothetical protein F1189_23225 [Rhodovastum atsumiense]CAH2606439.1 conserved protein of unknown function [Rhodovastum atsumiense]